MSWHGNGHSREVSRPTRPMQIDIDLDPDRHEWRWSSGACLAIVIAFLSGAVLSFADSHRQEWLCHTCRVIVEWMSHRILALVAVIALLSAPAAILAGTNPCAPAACTGICCARHAHNAAAHTAEAQCHHGGEQPDAHCGGTPRGHIDFGFVSPLPPTILAVATKLSDSAPVSSAIPARRFAAPSGFVNDVIKPPRA